MAAIAASAGRCPISAQCKILGVPGSTCCRLKDRPEPEEAEDPVAGAVEDEFRKSGGRYGARRIKEALARRGIAAGRRRIGAAMRSRKPASCRAKAEFGPRAAEPDEADLPNVLNREFDGHAPHAHVASDLAYVRVAGSWCCVCLLIDPCNRETVGRAAGAKKSAGLVKAAFAAVAFPLFDIDVFHSDRGSESGNAALDEMFGAFGITRSLSEKGRPCDNAVDESANKTLKAEFVYREQFSSLYDLQVKLSDYAWWRSNERMHSTLGYMSPVEFRKSGCSL